MTETGPIANTFLIGAQRTGTTNLAHLLGLHPDINVSKPKEPLFFTRHWERGLEWYAQHFEPGTTVRLDASTWYSVAPTPSFPEVRGEKDRPLIGVPSRIHSVCPDAKIIYIVRNPVVRTNSLFWLLRREHPDYRALGSLSEAMKSDPFLLRGSDYIGQIELYLEYFGRERVLVLVFERVIRDLRAALRICFEFLGVDPCVEIETDRSSSRNESFSYSAAGEVLRRVLLSTENLERVRRRIRRIEWMRAGERFDRLVTQSIPEISSTDRVYLQDLFRERNDRLAEFIGTDLVEWS